MKFPKIITAVFLSCIGLAVALPAQAAVSISDAKWNAKKSQLEVKGSDGKRALVTVKNAGPSDAYVGEDVANNGGKWSIKLKNPPAVPCTVYAVNDLGESSAVSTVSNAPADCDDGGTPPLAQCEDGIDNDGDGLIDFPADPGCDSPADDDETDAPPAGPQCSDGIDNDGDGLIDFGEDPGCTDANDDNERDVIDIGLDNPQTDFKIMMNYELGMHCTGFEFAYCCVLPAYNSILAQVVKPNGVQGFPELLGGDPNVGRDALGRETVVRDTSRTGNNFDKYVLTYWHDAQPRNDGNGKEQTSTLISAVEGNSLMSWNTTFESAATDPVTGVVSTGPYNGADGVVLGDDDGFADPTDSYQNAVWNHLYFYWNNGGPPLEGENPTGDSLEKDKIRLGVSDHIGAALLGGTIAFPSDCGPAFHPMGPVTQNGDPNATPVGNDCGGFANGNVLTFSDHSGTVVYTQMKVLENLPIMLTSPDIWEALGLPLTAFEDSIDFFGEPGLVDEDSVRPFVAMKAQLHRYDPSDNSVDDGDAIGVGAAVLDGDQNPVIGFGTAPIDIPNCERCHSNPVDGTDIPNHENEGGGMLTVANSPNDQARYALVEQEYNYWVSVYPSLSTGADWYARLKSAAISMLSMHDDQHGTSFAANYPGTDVAGVAPQNTRLGHESVICQRCHADNVIAAVKSATHNGGVVIPPVTEAIHNNHKSIAAGGTIAFSDSLGRDGGCQGCHPAHRSDGDMMGYPITLAGTNLYANGDNRGANGGCFVGRDVHSNPNKDIDGAETPEHLNAVGQWLSDNVASTGNGIWCTNCHNQLGQEMWKTENMTSLVHNEGTVNPRGAADLAAVAAAVGTTEAQAISWIDPKSSNAVDDTYAIWAPDPGLCDYVAGYLGGAVPPAHDGAVATVEVSIGVAQGTCSNNGAANAHQVPVDCGFAQFDICGSLDGDGDFNVNLVGNTEPDAGPFGGAFCTTPDCVASAQATLPGACGTGTDGALAAGDDCAVPVPFSAATDGRDHWLSAGEPHCADCHAAPYVEQSGNINAYPPFNYPRKASLMRYSRGHQDISCQGCHESIHGLYPVTPNIDTTSYKQAAALNADGSHGPLKCETCHDVDNQGIPSFMDTSGNNVYGITDYDSAVTWAHTYTDEQSTLDTTCQNCHGVQGTNWQDMGTVSDPDQTYIRHASQGSNPRGSRQMMDKAEIEFFGAVLAPVTPDGSDGLCVGCHGDESNNVDCANGQWLNHLTLGRIAASTFEDVSTVNTGGTCW